MPDEEREFDTFSEEFDPLNKAKKAKSATDDHDEDFNEDDLDFSDDLNEEDDVDIYGLGAGLYSDDSY